MARLFTAIELTDSARAAVARTQQDLLRAVSVPSGPRLRPVRSTELHLTMAFIGEVPQEHVAVIAAAIAEGFDLDPFVMIVAGAGTFPPRGPARVLWLGAKDEGGRLEHLFRLVTERLTKAGVSVEQGRWTPHLTLGRWRDSGPRSPRVPSVGVVATQTVTEVVLVQSELRADGPVHRVVAHGALSPTSASLH